MDTGNPIRYVPIGQSGAAAVVVGALYVLGGAATIVSWVWCKFEFYEVRFRRRPLLPIRLQDRQTNPP